MNNKKLSYDLQGVIAQMLKPLKDLPFGIVIEGLSGHKVKPYSKKSKKDKKVLSILKKIAEEVLSEINKKGISRSRANEVGNDIESYVKNALNKHNYKANTPKTFSGKKKSMGYPDIEFIDEFNRQNYLECKTYNLNNVDSTQRSFYLSPSDDFKITKNAHHFGISFEIYVANSIKNKHIYKAKSWKILDLSPLKLNVKYEFNTNNKMLYDEQIILAEKK